MKGPVCMVLWRGEGGEEAGLHGARGEGGEGSGVYGALTMRCRSGATWSSSVSWTFACHVCVVNARRLASPPLKSYPSPIPFPLHPHCRPRPPATRWAAWTQAATALSTASRRSGLSPIRLSFWLDGTAGRIGLQLCHTHTCTYPHTHTHTQTSADSAEIRHVGIQPRAEKSPVLLFLPPTQVLYAADANVFRNRSGERATPPPLLSTGQLCLGCSLLHRTRLRLQFGWDRDELGWIEMGCGLGWVGLG